MVKSATTISNDELKNITQLVDSGKVQTAKTKLNQVMANVTKDDRALGLKSVVAEAEGDLYQALDLCRQAQKMAPDNLLYQRQEGLLNVQLKEWEAAQRCLLPYLDKCPEDMLALNAIITVFAATKNKHAHLITLIRMAAISPLTDLQKLQFFALSSEVKIIAFSSAVQKGLLAILGYEDLNSRVMSTNICSYVIAKYKVDQPDVEIELSEVCEDELLLTALGVIRLCNPTVELFLTKLREALLRSTLQNQTLAPEVVKLVVALGLQNYLNEYVNYISDSEQELLTQVMQLLQLQTQQQDWAPVASEALLLLLALYQGFYELPIRETLLKFPLPQWPQNLQQLAKLTLFDIHDECELAQSIPALTPVEDVVSKAVQAHYEQNPYPRWNSIKVRPLTHVAQLILSSAPQVKGKLPKEFFDPASPIYVAGCGTGMQPISAALRFPKAQITALDISRRSLAYAKMKADQLKLTNIDFYHGDLLSAAEHLGKYHYIECSGVLHHMQDPKLGWQRLLDSLIPGGILKIALYSATARQDITKERYKIAQLKMEPTPANIRRYRQAMLNQKERSSVVTMFSDFYSLSECRDLLFHQHEQCFSWEKVQEHCESLHVKFLGILNAGSTVQIYMDQYPGETNTASLEKLSALEAKKPFLFSTMYQFMVQKI